MNIFRQKFLILGVSKSGFNACKFLLNNGAECYFYEEFESEKTLDAMDKLKALGASQVSKENVDNVIYAIDVLIISPGVKINHEVAVKCRQLGKRIMGELEFGFQALMPEIIAVTGTNGKTTTVNLINSIYNNASKNTHLLGNVGVPICEKIDKIERNSVCIVEVSSFQLESVSAFCPHISCVLNISPDHLERHFTMENYVYLKKRIFKNQKESEYTVLNFDDQTVKGFFEEVRSKIVWVSVNEKVDGAYRLDGKLYFKGEYIMDENSLILNGEHNVQNALFAIACAKIDGIDNKDIVSALENFKGIEHRIELVDKINGVSFFNDSKSTNTNSTINAIKSISLPKILILGGSEKGEKYDELFKAIKSYNVKHVVLCGASRFNMLTTAIASGYSDITLTKTLDSAMKVSVILAEDGDGVILSPACASFDEFSSYEERGKVFKTFVESLR